MASVLKFLKLINIKGKKSSIAVPEKKNDDEDQPQLTQLNDDCLFLIFNYLSPKELCAVNQCSKRLNTVANAVMSHRMASELIVIKRLPSLRLERWGTYVTNLSLFIYCSIDEVEEVHRCCPNLEKLTFFSLKLKAFSTPHLGEIFAKLNYLCIEHIEDSRTTLSDMFLHITRIFNVDAISSEERYRGHIVKTMSRCKRVTTLGSPSQLKELFCVDYPELTSLYLFGFKENDLINEFVKRHDIRNLRISDFDIYLNFDLDCAEPLSIQVK